MERIIDLSTPLESNKGEIAQFIHKKVNHKRGRYLFWQSLRKKYNYSQRKQKYFLSKIPDDEFINLDRIDASVHTGTHIDAPFHYGSKCRGKPAKTIDEIPIDWFWGDGLVLDFTEKNSGEFICQHDIAVKLEEINYVLKGHEIVLIRTGADKYWGKKKYFEAFPGLTKEAVLFLTEAGIKVIGTDAYSMDRPMKYMINDLLQGEADQFFQAHIIGRKTEYCHIERLSNLEALPAPHGFKVACFPIKITGSGAAWSRVVAIINEEKSNEGL